MKRSSHVVHLEIAYQSDVFAFPTPLGCVERKSAKTSLWYAIFGGVLEAFRGESSGLIGVI